jgi:hypothetical protein
LRCSARGRSARRPGRSGLRFAASALNRRIPADASRHPNRNPVSPREPARAKAARRIAGRSRRAVEACPHVRVTLHPASAGEKFAAADEPTPKPGGAGAATDPPHDRAGRATGEVQRGRLLGRKSDLLARNALARTGRPSSGLVPRRGRQREQANNRRYGEARSGWHRLPFVGPRRRHISTSAFPCPSAGAGPEGAVASGHGRARNHRRPERGPAREQARVAQRKR